MGASLIPPNTDVQSYFNSSGIAPPTTPTVWHTANESYTKIVSYVNPNPDLVDFPRSKYGSEPPCFRVWLTNGIMEEFGCTPGSMQFYPAGYQSQFNYVSAWKLDLITDPSGNQIHITYADSTYTDPTSHTAYPRDIVPATVEWDSPSCHNAQAMCTGSAWQPRLRVQFNAANTVANASGSTCGAANSDGSRCDDPLAVGNAPAPMIESTNVLNSLAVQASPTGNQSSWNTLHSYKLSYSQTGWINNGYSPVSGNLEGDAGELLLKQVQELGTDGATGYPPTTFSYAPQQQNYLDGFNISINQINTTQCGPSWDPTLSSNPTSCILYGQTNHSYLVSADNGEGGHQAFTWAEAHNNTHNTPSGLNPLDPTVCTSQRSNGSCATADDGAWSQMVLATKTTQTVSATNQTLTGTDTYTYGLTHLTSVICTDCTVGMYWGDESDLDFLDFYGHSFKGFSTAQEVRNDGLTVQHTFNATEGIGVYNAGYVNPQSLCLNPFKDSGGHQIPCTTSAAWDLVNATSGAEIQTDTFDAQAHLLNRAVTTYQATCPPSGVAASTPIAFYTITNKSSGKVLEVPNYSITQGQQLDQWTSNNGTNQQWQELAIAGGYVTLVNRTNHMDVDVASAATNDGAAIIQYPADGGSNQQWSLVAVGDGSYKIVNHNSGKVIDDPNGSLADGALMAQWTDNNGANQHWTITQINSFTWDNHLVGPLDPTNPQAVCAAHVQQTVASTVNGVTNTPTPTTVPTVTTSYTYDSSGRVTKQTTTGSSGAPSVITKSTSYVWNDAVTLPNTGAPTGTYIIDTVANTKVENSDGSVHMGCTDTHFDGMGAATGQTSGLATVQDGYGSCGTVGNGWATSQQRRTTTSYDTSGNPLGATDADANAGVTGHTGTGTNGACSTLLTTCKTYDANYGVLPATGGNVAFQNSAASYTTTAAGGFGLWPTSATDANNQTTSLTYDALGRATSTTLPGETAANTTQMAYTTWCPATGAALACDEVDTTQRLDSTTTVTSRTFYDGAGRPVESRTPGAGGQDVITYALYDNLGQRVFVSHPYFVTAYTGAPGAAAFSTPDTNQLGTKTTYDVLGRATISQNAILFGSSTSPYTTTTSYTVTCAPAGTNGDTGCYVNTTVIDANGHQHLSLGDALGRAVYGQDFTGAGPYTLYRTTKAQYDLLGDVTSTTYTDGSHQATATYDDSGRQTAFTDPDLGTYALTYDANGNLLSSADPRGASGTLYLKYDGLNRVLWKSTNSNGSSPLATASYDSTASGNQGKGRMTGETFASGPSQSVTGSYAYTYDARGQQTGWTMTLGATSYLFSTSYNDAGQATSLTYPDGDVVTTSYSAQDWLAGVTETKGSTTNTLLNTVSYTGANGAAQLPTQATVDNGVYTWNLSYDTNLRLTENKVKQVSNNSTPFDQTRTFDNAGNVVTTNTQITGNQTDNQVFCYDEQNRLVWAGSTGTPSCGTTLTPGTLNTQQAQYTQTYAYDVLNRLTQGPLGTGYTYGDTNHLDAVTSATGYTASYDAAGDMTGRNGNVLGYDALRRLITWQNTATSPTQTASYAYDGSGNRVQQAVTSGGATTTTTYVGSYEEVSVTGGTTTTTKYYSAGVANVVNVNGTLTYLVADALSSVSVALTAAGGVQATNLYSPYGSVRYTNGTMPTSYGYTKMRQDPSGLNYDHARYYDASVGQFISADSVQGPNRYGYVAGNPETLTDPTGQFCGLMCGGGLGGILAAIGAAAIAAGIGAAIGSFLGHRAVTHSAPTSLSHGMSSGGKSGRGGSTSGGNPGGGNPRKTGELSDPTPPPGCSSYGGVQLPGCSTTLTPTPTKPTHGGSYTTCASPSSQVQRQCDVLWGGNGGEPGGLLALYDSGSRALEIVNLEGVQQAIDLLERLLTSATTILGGQISNLAVEATAYWWEAVAATKEIIALNDEISAISSDVKGAEAQITQLSLNGIGPGQGAIFVTEENITRYHDPSILAWTPFGNYPIGNTGFTSFGKLVVTSDSQI